MQDTTVTKDAKTDGNTGQNGSTDISAGIKQESKNTDNSTQVSAAISKKILQEQFIAGQSFQIMVCT